MAIEFTRRTVIGGLLLATPAVIAACNSSGPKCIEERTPLEGGAGEAISPCGKTHPDTAAIYFRIDAGILDTPNGWQQLVKPDNKYLFRSQITYQKAQGVYWFAAALGELPSAEARGGFQIHMSGELFEPGKDTYLFFSWDKWKLRNPIINLSPIPARQLSAVGTRVIYTVPQDRVQYAPSGFPREYFKEAK
jgi:hypothetical protein